MRGNHHDAWVHGAADPVSGMVALMEEARVIGELAKKGQRPKRTLVYCAWDAEEPGLIGSTEWVEHHKEELQKKAVAYINTDGNGRGFFNAGGSHTLQTLVSEVAEVVSDPQKGVSIKERKIAKDMINGGDDKFELYALGSGSDYTPFIQHAGIASLNLGFGGENAGGEYHTIYDTYTHYKRFKDPEFAYGAALAKTAGRIVLRLANADILPFAFDPLRETVSTYLEEVMKSCETMREAVEKHNKLIDENAFYLASDPVKPFIEPKKKEHIPYLDFTPILNSMISLRATIVLFNSIDINSLSDSELEAMNKQLMHSELALTDASGLPRRPWYKHQIYAPGFYTGYGVKTLPGVREAIEQKEWPEAQEQIKKLAQTLNNLNNHIKSIYSITKNK